MNPSWDPAPGVGAVVQASALIGRDTELAVIDQFLTSAASGRSALAISGEAGIGKTAFWQQVAETAGDGGWEVLRARRSEAEAGDASAGLMDLLEARFDHLAADLPTPLSAALAAALLRAPEGHHERGRLAATLRWAAWAESVGGLGYPNRR